MNTTKISINVTRDAVIQMYINEYCQNVDISLFKKYMAATNDKDLLNQLIERMAEHTPGALLYNTHSNAGQA